MLNNSLHNKSHNSSIVGLIGLGYWGINILRNFYSLGVLNTACDSDPRIVSERKKKFPEFYSRELAGIEELILPINDFASQLPETSTAQFIVGHVYHQYTIRTSRRDELRAYLKNEGISTMIYYPTPLDRMSVFEAKMKTYEKLINSRMATEEVLSLPLEPLQKEENTKYVVNCIKQFFNFS